MSEIPYKDRIDMLIDSVKNSRLNNEEFSMLYGILDLSRDRNNFNKQYNEKVNEIIKNKVD